MYEPLLLELVSRGHGVTVVNSLPSTRTQPIKNYREVTGTGLFPDGGFNVFEMKKNLSMQNPFIDLPPIIRERCPKFFESGAIKELMREKYDLVIMESFMNECIFGLLHHFNTTFIFINTFPLPFWFTRAAGLYTFPSITPLPFLGYTDDMSFVERSWNFVVQILSSLMIQYSYHPKMEAVYRKYTGENTPSVEEISRKVSLILDNGHPSLNFPKPLVRDIVDVGGMHCKPPKLLSQDLEEFLKKSGSDGFIYFSLGSIIKARDMPEKQRLIFLNVFSKLKQQVIWKWEEESMPGLPPNVKLSKWLPQQDVLGHRKCKLFITHGGLLSLQESVYHGVPVLGFPFFGDQKWNAHSAEQKGFGKKLDFDDLTEEGLLKTILELLKPRYVDKVQALSQLFKDEPITPLAKAVFYVELVLRHKGFPYRSPARDLNFFQYFSLDVIGLILVGLILLLLFIYFLIKLLLKYASGRKGAPGQVKQKKQKEKKL